MGDQIATKCFNVSGSGFPCNPPCYPGCRHLGLLGFVLRGLWLRLYAFGVKAAGYMGSVQDVRVQFLGLEVCRGSGF